MASPLSAAIEREIGVPTEPRVNPETGSVGTSIVKIAGNNGNRFGLLVINLGTAAVYIAPDNVPSSTRGIRLAPGGGSFTLSWRDDFNLVGWEWFAIADAAAQSVFVMEIVAR